MVRQTEEIHLVNEDNTDHVRESIDTFKIAVLDTMEELNHLMPEDPIWGHIY